MIAINPKSLLGSNMVQYYFVNASGLYFDNDNEKFADPDPSALNTNICQSVMDAIDNTIARLSH